MASTEQLGRFCLHPDPAIDFCVEVETIEGEWLNIQLGFENGTPSKTDLRQRVEKAMEFRVGGDLNAMAAKTLLRRIDSEMNPSIAEKLTLPEGWNLVPSKPTEAMKVAGCDHDDPLGRLVDWNEGNVTTRETVAGVYEAMIAAAPALETHLSPFGTFVERSDGSTEFRLTGEVHSGTAQGYKCWTLYAGPPPAKSLSGVKRLRWYNPKWNHYNASTPFGTYRVEDQTDLSDETLNGRRPFLLTLLDGYTARFSTFEASKEAAQTDYVERITSTLENPLPAENKIVTDAMVARAQSAHDAAKEEWRRHPEAPLAMMPRPMRAALEAAFVALEGSDDA